MTPRPVRPFAIAVAGVGIMGALAGCSTDAATASSVQYKDGTYTEDGSYQSPAGPEKITVKLTLAANKITAVTVTPQATSGNPKAFQDQFASGIADVVVGKDINSISVSRVAGSSLTSGGFNAAVTAIKADAS